MLNLTQIRPLMEHLKSLSNKLNISGNEIIMYCPYCNDSQVHHNHGHLYISTSYPIFNCFYCSTSGTLIRLLIDTGFDDKDVIDYLSQFVKYNFIKDYYSKNKSIKSSNISELKTKILKTNLNIFKNYNSVFNDFRNYLKNRIGDVDFADFLIEIGSYYNKLSCNFYNSDNELIVQRLIYELIRNGKLVKHNLNSNNPYYFQEKNFEQYNSITLSEGPFDIISLYLYNNEFKSNFFISVNGKKYVSVIEKLIIEHLLIGKYIINIIFDNDVTNTNKFLFRAKYLSKSYNEDIIIKGWKPIIKKDTGDFPVVVEI